MIENDIRVVGGTVRLFSTLGVGTGVTAFPILVRRCRDGRILDRQVGFTIT